MSAIVSRMGTPSILLATEDPLLRETRKRILRQFGFEVKAPVGKQQTLELIVAESFGLLVVGNTLSIVARAEIASAFREAQPHARIVEIVSSPGESATTNPDAVVVGLDGPLALKTVIEAQLNCE
jgi:hypothetical protein